MTNKENEELFAMLEKGDKTARDELIKGNLAFVNYIFQKNFYAKNYEDWEDFFQTGVIGLIKAVDAYKIGKCNFSTFAYTCIKNEIAMALRKLPPVSDISLDAKVNCDDDACIADFVGTDADIEEDIVKRDTILQLKKLTKYKLNKTQAEVISLRYFSGEEVLNQENIANRLNLSQGAVSRIEKKAIVVLKQAVLGEMQ